MARPTRRRAEANPLTVRLSPAERDAFAAKAQEAGMKVSDAARAALEAWDPAARAPAPSTPDGPRVEYDPVD
jgi:hypothetical protein